MKSKQKLVPRYQVGGQIPKYGLGGLAWLPLLWGAKEIGKNYMRGRMEDNVKLKESNSSEFKEQEENPLEVFKYLIPGVSSYNMIKDAVNKPTAANITMAGLGALGDIGLLLNPAAGMFSKYVTSMPKAAKALTTAGAFMGPYATPILNVTTKMPTALSTPYATNAIDKLINTGIFNKLL